MPADEDLPLKETEEEDGEEETSALDAGKKKKNKKKKKKVDGADVGLVRNDAQEATAGTTESDFQAAPAPQMPSSAAPEGEEDDDATGSVSEAKKKSDKKKAAKARKKAAAIKDEGGDVDEEPSLLYDVSKSEWDTVIRGIRRWGPYPKPEKGGKRQTTPPTIPVISLAVRA